MDKVSLSTVISSTESMFRRRVKVNLQQLVGGTVISQMSVRTKRFSILNKGNFKGVVVRELEP
jgi:hypothetical protein